MAHCINTSSKDFQKLVQETGFRPEVLAAKISIWQDRTKNLEDFPTKYELYQYELEKEYPKINSEVGKIVNEIQKTDKSAIVQSVDEYFTIISNHLRNLKEKKSYERLKKIFTNSENINKLASLQDILLQAQKVEDSIQGDARQIRAIAQTIVQIDALADLMIEDVKELVKNTDDSIENLHFLQSYLNTINDWDILLDEANKSFAIGNPITTKKIGEVKAKLKQIETYIAKNDESGVIKTLQDILIPSSQDMIKIITEELNKTQEKLQRQINRKADTKTIEETKKTIQALNQKIKDIDFENVKNVIDFLKGKRGDATVFNSWLESFRDSSDPTIAAFATFVKRQIDEVSNEVYKIDLQYQKELAPLVKDSERLDPASLTKKITFEDFVYEDGEMVKVLTLLNPWKNYRADYAEVSNQEQEAKQRYLETKLDEDKQDYLQKRKDRQKFEQDYLYTEFKPEVYEKYKLFDDEIGQELKKDSDRIWEKISEIDESYKLFGTELTDEEQEEKEALLLEYKMLGNLNKPDGTPKTGRELEKAERMQEVRALNRQFYKWVDNLSQYEKAKKRHSEYIISTGIEEDSPDYKTEMKKWEDDNTRVVIKEEFYKERDSIVKEIAIITKKFKDEKIDKSISELWKTVQSITYGLRDEDNQPIGTLIEEKGAERIKAAQEAIQNLKNQVSRISGLNVDEQAEMSRLFEKAKNREITEEERLDLDYLVDKSKAEGLNKDQKERLFELFEELANLQSNVPTEYYIQAFNNVSTKYSVTILENGEVVEEDGTIVPILRSKKLRDLLTNKDFKDWFELNHLKVEKYNRETESKELLWERTYQWNKIVPNNPAYREVKPSLKYSYREIKPEYKTERILGETVDNKGNWLPNPDKTASAKYRNEKYFNLIQGTDSESKRLSKILGIHTKYLLKTQEGIARQHRLYLDAPKAERETREQGVSFLREAIKSPGSIPKLIWESIKEKYNALTSYNVSDVRYESPFDGKYEKDFIKIPMKLTGKIDIDKISYDLQKNISSYTYASELNKKLAEALPLARALARVVEKADEYKPRKKKQNTRIRAIQKIILKEFEGQKTNLDLKKIGEAEKPITATINLMKYLASWATIKINIPAAVANVVNAINQNWINAGNSLYSKKTFASSAGIYATRFFPQWQRDYYENKLGELSLESQLADVWEPVQGITIESKLGEKFSQSKAYDTLSANWLFNMREWGEYHAQSRVWLAALQETKVNYNQDVISLVDAYELDSDGIIKLKDGIDKSWEVGGKNFVRLKEKIQNLNRKIHGNYATYDKTQLEMYALGSLAMFLKRFFVSMAANRFAAAGWTNIHEGRFNINTGFQYGYYTATLSIIVKQIKNGLKDWDLLTVEQKRALLKTATEAGVIFGALALMSLMGYSGDDRNKKEKLKGYSWLELHVLYQLDRLYIETSSFISLKSYFDYTFDFQIKTALEKWYKLLTDFISQDEYESSLKNTKGEYVYKKGEKKWKIQLKRATGIQQLILTKEDPDVLLKNYDRTIRGK